MVFAGFLIGLGGTLVGDLPKVEKQLSLDDFMDRAASASLCNGIKNAERAAQDADEARNSSAGWRRAIRVAARETLNNWLATRRATQRCTRTRNCWPTPVRWTS